MIVVKLEDKGFLVFGKPYKPFSFWFMLLFYFGFSLNALNLYWACVQNNPVRGFFAYACLAMLLVIKLKVVDTANNKAKICNILSREYDIYEVSK
jgi:hypothetical protein